MDLVFKYNLPKGYVPLGLIILLRKALQQVIVLTSGSYLYLNSSLVLYETSDLVHYRFQYLYFLLLLNVTV